jgi:glycosyltransferase involved in cell wall biosynthesis
MISVIIPTYNRATLLMAAIESVLRQTRDDFEIIVVDDGSTDDTEHRVRNSSHQLVYLKQPNAGVNAARNRGIAVARGEYIALLDSDDLWFDFKLQLQCDLLERFPDVGFVFSDFVIRKESGQDIGSGLSTWHRHRSGWVQVFPQKDRVTTAIGENKLGPTTMVFDVYKGDIYKASLHQPYVLPSTALIRRRCIDPDIRLVDHDSTCGDWDFFARLSHRHSALYMDVETTVNRSHEDEVRLTRLPQATQTRRRLDMIDRVWAADRDFCSQHGHEIDLVRNELLVKLAKHQAMEGDIAGARESLARRSQTRNGRISIKDRIIANIIRLPGAGAMLKFSRWAQNEVRRRRE